MELLEEKIEKWLKVDTVYGAGECSGDGSGDGTGYGAGECSGDGSGDGTGYGAGDGFGFGRGCSNKYNSGYGLKSINGNKIYKIDGIQTIISHVNRNVARGKIVNIDLTFDDCYVVKGHNQFAHGKTIKEAMQSLEEKIFDEMDTEEAIEEFRKKFKNSRKYKGTTFFKWHHNLTGSCLMGRENFVKNHELDLNKMYSVQEFIKLTENDYGGSVIKELKQYYRG